MEADEEAKTAPDRPLTVNSRLQASSSPKGA